MPNERLRRTESRISIVDQQKNEEILSYLKQTDSDLRKKKKQLNEQITKAYKENNINTKQGRKTLRDLHNVWHHLTVKNELKAIFGFDVIDFYSKKFEYNDDTDKKNYVNMMLKIEDIMKKEGNTESKHITNLTKKEKKELHMLYKEINHLFAEGSLSFNSARSSATLIDEKIQDFLEKGILAHFEKYDYYDLNKSKTLSRLGLNKWNIKYLLDLSSKDQLVQEGSKTLEQGLYGKSEEELRELKKDLHSSIMKESKADKKQMNTDELKNNLRQFFEVRHQLFARQVIKKAIDIDVEKFCQKYVSRIWIDPKQQAGLFQAEVSMILKADKKKMNAEEEHELKKESTSLKKNIHSIYKKMQKLDQKKEWTKVHAQTRRMIDEMNQLVKTSAAINARGYDYYSVENDQTLINLSMYVNECRLEDTQIRSEHPMNDISRVEEETSRKSDLKNPQMDAHSTAKKIESEKQNQSFVMKTEKAAEKAKQQEDVVSSKEQQQQPANEQLNDQLFIADNDSDKHAIADLTVEAINHEIITKEFLVKQEETGEKAGDIQISEKKELATLTKQSQGGVPPIPTPRIVNAVKKKKPIPTPRSKPREADNRIPHDSEPIYAEIIRNQNYAGFKSSPEVKTEEPQHLIIETVAQVHREAEADNRMLRDSEPIYTEIIWDQNHVGSKSSPKAMTQEPQKLPIKQVQGGNPTPQPKKCISELTAPLAARKPLISNPKPFENKKEQSKQESRNANVLKSLSQPNSHENVISMA